MRRSIKWEIKENFDKQIDVSFTTYGFFMTWLKEHDDANVLSQRYKHNMIELFYARPQLILFVYVWIY